MFFFPLANLAPSLIYLYILYESCGHIEFPQIFIRLSNKSLSVDSRKTNQEGKLTEAKINTDRSRQEKEKRQKQEAVGSGPQ